ncbi:hypothetical protein EX895_001544 [Sporisorium graminicola]|uniref:non-specific serine/threonine protein kinase n=1 Tax=Sporisorium graminicola TaxID=280036 RepID=A0A4V6EU90_9BASI|nr:hypothetical protein EX895_001544 [Sporisorium graminicola]TKY89759.1 hypothetical protein EX895_001544 [Sporisorium graminicola]
MHQVEKGQKAKLGITGTPGFRSPEMLKVQQYGTATDIWSLGNVLWELFTGFSSHREIEAGSCKKNVRINLQSARKTFARSQTVKDMLSQQDFVRPGTGDLLNDPGILEALYELWHPDR